MIGSPVSGGHQGGSPGSESGFGVTEVLIALVIFSTAMLGIVGTSARVGASLNSSHVKLRSGAIARHQVEQLLAADYDAVTSGSTVVDEVEMAWAVSATSAAKEIVLVYRYELPGGVRQDTLTAARLQAF